MQGHILSASGYAATSTGEGPSLGDLSNLKFTRSEAQRRSKIQKAP